MSARDNAGHSAAAPLPEGVVRQWKSTAFGLESRPVPDLSGFIADADPGAHWLEFASCAEVDPELFFPERGGSVSQAKRICRSCLVRAECLGYALDNDFHFGVWGGLSEGERRRAKRQAA